MTTPLVRNSLLAAALLLGAAPAPAVNVSGSVGHAPTGTGFSALPGSVKIEFANALSAVSMQAMGLGAETTRMLTAPSLANAGRPAAAMAPAEAAKASAERVIAFLANSPAETETEFRARRAALGALWAEDPRYMAGLVEQLKAAGTPETSRAADSVSRLVEQYRPAVDSVRARMVMDIPSLMRLEQMGSFEDIGSLFDNSLRRSASVTDAAGLAPTDAHPGQLELFSPDAMAHMAGAHLAKPSPGQRQGVNAVGAVVAPPVEALSAANDGPQAGKSTPGMVGSAKQMMMDQRGPLARAVGMFGIGGLALGGVLGLNGMMNTGGAAGVVGTAVAAHALSPVALAILQVSVIVLLAHLLGMLLEKIGQPRVLGQVLGGIMLGPMLLGQYLPAGLFPAASLGSLDMIGTIGLLFFMFAVGMELPLGQKKAEGGSPATGDERPGEALTIALAGMILPAILGALLAIPLYAMGGVTVSPVIYASFLGVVMSVTAVPVLAGILKDKGLMNTRSGQLAFRAAVITDLLAWPALALVASLAVGGGGMGPLMMLGSSLAYIGLVFALVRPMFKRYAQNLSREKARGVAALAIPILTVVLSALATDIIGIHLLFGAFLIGVIIPRDSYLHHALDHGLKGGLALLLPVYFAVTGLKMTLGALTNPMAYLLIAAIVAVRVLGKIGGGVLGGRLTGESWRNAFKIGNFLNTGGLVELVVLNIGRELGILPTEQYVMFVIMAIAATLLTAPINQLIDRRWPEARRRAAPRTANA